MRKPPELTPEGAQELIKMLSTVTGKEDEAQVMALVTHIRDAVAAYALPKHLPPRIIVTACLLLGQAAATCYIQAVQDTKAAPNN